MCGIAGIKRFGPAAPLQAVHITSLLLALEHRGNDATGIAIMDPALPRHDRIHIHKLPIPASTFVGLDSTKEFLTQHLTETADTVLLHTRTATVGNPKNPDNNHPLHTTGAAIVHNGGISNESYLYTSLHLTRNGQVDSDIIRAILDHEGLEVRAFKTLSRMSGSAAIAAVHQDFPGRLLLARSGSPLELAAVVESEDATVGQLFWASERNAIHRALRPWQRAFGLWTQPSTANQALFAGVPDDTGYLFGPEGLLAHDAMRVCYNYIPPCYKVHTHFANKQARFEFPAKSATSGMPPSVLEQLGGPEGLVEGAEFICPNGCGKHLVIPRKLVGKPLSQMQCVGCKKTLG